MGKKTRDKAGFFDQVAAAAWRDWRDSGGQECGEIWREYVAAENKAERVWANYKALTVRKLENRCGPGYRGDDRVWRCIDCGAAVNSFAAEIMLAGEYPCPRCGTIEVTLEDVVPESAPAVYSAYETDRGWVFCLKAASNGR
jgi:hypothetical protein